MAPAPHNLWLGRRVVAYAHQGGAWEAPSSTLFAIRRALQIGATGIELDVHATVDGHLVVCHDATVDRTTNGRGAIHTMTLAELQKLDNAFWFAPGADVTPGLAPDAYHYRGRAPGDHEFGIARLEEVLEVLAEHPKVALNLDIKATAPTVEPYEERLAKVLTSYGDTERIIVASFLDVATDAFRRYAPHIATSAGTLAVGGFFQAVRRGETPPPMDHVALQVPASHGDIVLVDGPFVTAAHHAGLAVHAWTINRSDDMERLVQLGVDGVITDLPTTLVSILATHASTWVP